MSNCSVAPDAVPSDAGVAGTGERNWAYVYCMAWDFVSQRDGTNSQWFFDVEVLLSFIITAVLALGISASLVFQEQFRGNARTSVVRRKLLNAYSDQQILTGIGIQSVGLVKMSTMVPYHFFIIWMLSLLSMAVHNATLVALVHDFRRDWVLRWLRQFLMFVNLVLSCVYGVFILQAVQSGLTDKTFPISCVWDSNQTKSVSSSSVATSFAGTIAVIAGNVILFGLATWYLHARTQRFYRIIQIVGLLLMTASAIGATVRVILDSQAFGNPPIKLSDKNEQNWSFGALLSIGMLLLPVVSVIEILRGDIKCAPPVADDEDKATLLGSNSNELHTFQPNPFFGNKTTISKI